ncbi:MAG: ribonuclease HI family protein [Candidatus Margulisiibacteriota bacterium]
MKVEVFCDGASRNNPGESGIGIVIKSGGKVLLEVSDYIGQTTNNIAEYMALIRGLEEALLLGAREAAFFCDSELLVKQINGEYKVKNEGLKPLHLHAKKLISKFKKFEINHTRRENNAHADELANKGIDEHGLKDSPLFGKM